MILLALLHRLPQNGLLESWFWTEIEPNSWGISGSFQDQQKFGFLDGAIAYQRMLVIFVERQCDRISHWEDLWGGPEELVHVRFRSYLVDVVACVEVPLLPDVNDGAVFLGASQARNQKEQQSGSERRRGFHRPEVTNHAAAVGRISLSGRDSGHQVPD
jgi:hypothetical protein